MSSRSLVLIALLSTLAMAPASAAPTGAAVPDDIAIDLIATNPASVEAFVNQGWSTERALRLRQSLDAFFGAGDQTLTPTELEKISAATETDMRSQKLSWLTVNAKPFFVQDATVTFGNATGRINDSRPLSMIHDLSLAAPDVPATDRAEMRVAPFANGTLRFRPPPDWRVVRTEGMDNVANEDDATTGSFRLGRPVVIEIASSSASIPTTAPTGGQPNPTSAPTSAATPSPGGGPPAPQESVDRAVPGPALPVIAAAVALVAFVLARRHR